MTPGTPETRCWIVGDVLATAVTENGESTVTLTCTTATPIDTVRAALAALAAEIQRAAAGRREAVRWKL